jgi:hypothetical protein
LARILQTTHKKAEFLNDKMSYLILWGQWCNIIIVNVHALIEDKADHVKDVFIFFEFRIPKKLLRLNKMCTHEVISGMIYHHCFVTLL